jgi:RNA polymerase sigma factor (sigma-70 family)
MVLGVCRRLLGTSQDVDDAFQATFLILVRKAPSIADGERVANWLYGVAYRVAVRARTQAARQRVRQRVLGDLPQEESSAGQVEEAVRVLLDEELNRLPARYREAIVCCYLEGRTQEETARLLGWPKGTVATRLNRARELLRTRLTRRGLALSGGTLTVLLTPGATEGALPAALISTTLHAAAAVISGGALPGAAGVLAEAVLRGFLLGRVKAVVAGALVVALAVGGGALSLPRDGAASESAVPPMPPRPRDHVQALVPARPSEREQAALPVKPRAEPFRLVIIVVDGHQLRIHSADASIWVGDPPVRLEPGALLGGAGPVVTVAFDAGLKPIASTSEGEPTHPPLVPAKGPAKPRSVRVLPDLKGARPGLGGVNIYWFSPEA